MSLVRIIPSATAIKAEDVPGVDVDVQVCVSVRMAHRQLTSNARLFFQQLLAPAESFCR